MIECVDGCVEGGSYGCRVRPMTNESTMKLM